MVSVPAPRPAAFANPVRRLLIAVCAALIALTVAAAPATADDSSGGTYGFDTQCQMVHDALEGIGIPGTPFNLGNSMGNMCKAGNAATHPGEAITAVKDKMWDSTFGKAVDSLLKGLGEALILAMTFWLKLPSSTMLDNQSLFTKVRDYLYQPQVYLLMASMIVCGVRLALAKRAARAEEAEETFRVLARAVAMAGGLSIVLTTATTASDQFAIWVVNDAAEGNAAGLMQTLVSTSSLQAFSPGLILVLAIGGILGALAQLVFAVIRQGLLIVVVGMLPLAACMSGFDLGRGFYKKLLTWTIAFLLWKPFAAIVYMIAFVTAKEVSVNTDTAATDSASAQKLLVGVVLLCCVGLLLPAVMRLASPIAGAASRGGSGFGAAALGGAMAARRLATGAQSSRGAGNAGRNTGGGQTPAPGGGNGGGGGPAPAGSPGAPGNGMPGPRGPAGPAGPAGGTGARGAQGAAARGGKGAAAGAAGAALVAVHAVGTGMRAAQSSVDAAANPKGSPRTPGGAAGRSAVPR